ncbi:flavin reductase family protein [Ornithinibacillus contaminans]|uniref:flavin reductase family protein n=1 Tax=Ornithinibacillus contaminans TaxID=694055 RepID=UPI00064E07A6|nr:flavin reductase family protein [Ornithinibacillus contaminans]
MDGRDYRNALGKFATGITVVATEYNEEIVAMTVNAFMSVSLDPRLIAIAIDQKATMYPVLQKTKQFGISILAEEQELLSKEFAKHGRSDEAVSFHIRDNVPVLEDALATFSCRIVDSIQAGDHLLFIAQVLNYTVSDGEPAIFYSGKYRNLT